MIGHAFTFVDTVLYWVDENHKRSQRALKKFDARRRPNLDKRAEADLKASYMAHEIQNKPSSWLGNLRHESDRETAASTGSEIDLR